jgi:cytochrome P450
MSNVARKSAVTGEDPRYEEIFDTIAHAKSLNVDLVEDQYPALLAARARGGVLPGTLAEVTGIPAISSRPEMYDIQRPHFTALSFAAVDEILTNNEVYSSAIHYEFFPSKQMGKTILNLGGAAHRQYRGTVQPLFTRRNVVDWWQPRWIEGLVDELVGTFEKRGKAELNQDLCARLPMHTITRAFGLASDVAIEFRVNLLTGINYRKSLAERQAADEAISKLLNRAILERREKPADDVITRLATAEFTDEDGTRRILSDDEIISFCKLVMTAGGGTTWCQLGITLFALMSNPDQFEAVKNDRQLIDAALRESLRWHNTSPHFIRLTTRDVVLEGVEIPEGAVVEFNLNAANRDPDRWKDADRYDIFREAQRHLAFGGGAHACIGMFIALAEMRIAINALSDRLPNLRFDPAFDMPRVTGTIEMRGISHLNVLFG